jgi:hypothetical protein
MSKDNRLKTAYYFLYVRGKEKKKKKNKFHNFNPGGDVSP